jgi:hypothetical protein
MRANIRVATFLALISTAAVFVPDAGAQQHSNIPSQTNPMVNTESLPHVHWPQSPLRLNIVDPRPIVHSNLVPANSGINYEGMLVPGLPPAAPGTTVNVNAPGFGFPHHQGADNMGFRTDDPMVPNRDRLPQVGFGSESNVPSRPVINANNLPNGHTTGIHGSVQPWLTPASLNRRAGRSPNGALQQSAQATRPINNQTFMYSTQPYAAGSSGDRSGVGTVKGILRPPTLGERLIQKAH